MLDAKEQRGLVRREMWRSVMAPNTPAHEPAFLPLWKVIPARNTYPSFIEDAKRWLAAIKTVLVVRGIGRPVCATQNQGVSGVFD
jgi:hypothetical protein